MSSTGLTPLEFSCACENVRGSVQVPSSSLPLGMSLCHCNICRHQTGMLAASYVDLPTGYRNFDIKGDVRRYKTSENVTRYFCGICGSNVYVDDLNQGEIGLCSGAISNSEAKTRLVSHIFVLDTKDGGMATFLPAVPSWNGFSGESKQLDGSRLPGSHHPPDDSARGTDSELQCYCHCKSIQFKITRPNEASSQLHAPLSDLLAPHTTTKPETIANKDDTKWWLRDHGTKYLAGTCACDSCRTNSGFDLQSWAFIPKVNLLDIHSESGSSERQLDFETLPHLAEYRSSKEEGGVIVRRHFCSTCGSTCFWRSDSRPDLIDVSVGLLDAGGEEGGARAESWLEWWMDRVSFEEDAPNRVLVQDLQSGLRKWDVHRFL